MDTTVVIAAAVAVADDAVAVAPKKTVFNYLLSRIIVPVLFFL